MFSFEQLLGFAMAALICIIAPGPDNLSILSLGLSRGRIAGMGFALGCGLGCLTHTLWATLGVAAIIKANVIAFTILKFIGAAYLIYLGIIILKSGDPKIGKTEIENTQSERFVKFVSRGFISNALNPKVALFFIAFLPQFVNPNGEVPLQMAILGTLFSLMTICLFLLLGYFSGEIGKWLRSRAIVRKWLDRMTGGLFLGLGLHLILSRKAA